MSSSKITPNTAKKIASLIFFIIPERYFQRAICKTIFCHSLRFRNKIMLFLIFLTLNWNVEFNCGQRPVGLEGDVFFFVHLKGYKCIFRNGRTRAPLDALTKWIICIMLSISLFKQTCLARGLNYSLKLLEVGRHHLRKVIFKSQVNSYSLIADGLKKNHDNPIWNVRLLMHLAFSGWYCSQMDNLVSNLLTSSGNF
jgi:hypothetical protein